MNHKDKNILAQQRSARIKQLRSMIGLTAMQWSQKHRIPLATLKSWETVSQGGLTPKGAQRIIKAAHEDKIHCTIEWLMHGEGKPPTPISTNRQAEEFSRSRDAEIQQFCNQHPDSDVLTIKDDAMEPVYGPTDIIGGIWFQGDQIQSIDKKICLIETPDHHLVCRKLIYLHHTDRWRCYALNLESQTQHLVLDNVTLDKAAPIIRVWRGVS